jgi:hypothetical protein
MRLEEVKGELEESAKVQQQSAAAATTAKGSFNCVVRVFDCAHGPEILL